jgi:hypothetical protein
MSEDVSDVGSIPELSWVYFRHLNASDHKINSNKSDFHFLVGY